MDCHTLEAWRRLHRLKVRELAELFGMPFSTMRNKLKGRTRITRRLERHVAALDLLIHAGIEPCAWPRRLRWIIRAQGSIEDAYQKRQK